MVRPRDLLHPTKEETQRTHKLRRLIPQPNSFFMDVKCPGCMQITTVFSHSQTRVMCASCAVCLCYPRGGEAKLAEGCSFRRKNE